MSQTQYAPTRSTLIAATRLTHSAKHLLGREDELDQLASAWGRKATNILIVRGIGGEGKTSLVTAWLDQLAGRDYDGAAYFDWSFYSQGSKEQATVSSEPPLCQNTCLSS